MAQAIYTSQTWYLREYCNNSSYVRLGCIVQRKPVRAISLPVSKLGKQTIKCSTAIRAQEDSRENIESGVVTSKPSGQVLGNTDAYFQETEESVDEMEQDQKDAEDILKILGLLKTKRDMVFNEVRLSIMIEDPREVERKKELGIDDETGCTREELAEALTEVYEGNIPGDRMALRALADEMRNWPRLDEEETMAPLKKPAVSMYAKATNTGVDPKTSAKRAGLDADWDAAVYVSEVQEEKSIGEVLPPWMGYGVLYGLSFIPIIIGVAVVVILFLNSLQ